MASPKRKGKEKKDNVVLPYHEKGKGKKATSVG